MPDLVNVAPSQGRLQVDSTSQISLQRYNGKYLPLKISGTWGAKEIPSSGPTLSNSGLTQATLYYIYAYDSSGTLTLEASATAHALDSDTGLRIKSGDATRLLLGMVYMDTGSPGLFRDTAVKRWLANYWNRRPLHLTNTFSTDRTTTSTSLAEINSEIRVELVTWDDEAVAAGSTGTVSNNSAGQATYTGIAVDSTSAVEQLISFTSPGSNTRGPNAPWIAKAYSEGYHYITLLGAVSGGTGTWVTADNLGIGTAKTNLWARVRI